MRSLNFYHQKRRDGGVRTGVEVNGERVLEQLKGGRMPPDSALEWFVDLRCAGRNLPANAEGARRWLLEHGAAVQSQLAKLAGEISLGIDQGWPVCNRINLKTPGTTAEVVCSAVRRLSGRQIAKVLLNLSKAWPGLVANLPAFQAEAAA